MINKNRSLPLTITLLIILTACAPQPEETGETINREQAEEKTEQHLQDATNAFTEEIGLGYAGQMDSTPCEKPSPGTSDNYIFITKGYKLNDLPDEDNSKNVQTLIDYWEQNNYAITNDARGDQNFVAVEHQEDGFTLSLRESIQGTITLRASSPCIWPEGTPQD